MAEMSFLRRLAGLLSLRDRLRSSAVSEELAINPLLLHFEKRDEVAGLGSPAGEVFRARSFGWRPLGHAGEMEELGKVAGEREVWARVQISSRRWMEVGGENGLSGS